MYLMFQINKSGGKEGINRRVSFLEEDQLIQMRAKEAGEPQDLLPCDLGADPANGKGLL